MNMSKKAAHNSPLQIMSHMTRTCPWQQTAKNIPAIANRAYIFFWASGPAFFHRSTQPFRHLAKLSCSMIFSHAVSLELRSSCLSGSECVSGGAAADSWVEVLSWEGKEICWMGNFWEDCCYHGQWNSVIADANVPSLLHLWIHPLPQETSSARKLMNDCRYELSLHRMYCQLT